MTPAVGDMLAELIAELFYEQHSAAHSHPTTPKPSAGDIAKVDGLMKSGASFQDLKACMRWLFLTDQGRKSKWFEGESAVSSVPGFVNAHTPLMIRVLKHMPATVAGSSGASSSSFTTREGADHIASQKDPTSVDEFYRITGEERPSDDNREMYAPPDLKVVAGPETVRLALVESAEGDSE